MPRPLRLFEPDGIYFVSGRCLQARFLMRPSVETNRIIGGVLARAIDRFDIEVFAFVFASNHFHALVRSSSCRIPEFMQYLRSNLAKKLGALVDWHGKFWDRRYDAEPVLDDSALVGRLRYILAHGVKEGLVSHPVDWPGLTSIPELLGRDARAFAWPGGSATDSEPATALRLAPLPSWESDGRQTQYERVSAILDDIASSANEDRGRAPVLGVARILSQHPHDRPRSIKRSPRPLCHASTQRLRDDYATKFQSYSNAYAQASAAYRHGELDVEFPAFACRPPWVVPTRIAA